MPTIKRPAIVEDVKEITIAMVSNTATKANAESGKEVADFMQAVYNKLVELSTKAD